MKWGVVNRSVEIGGVNHKPPILVKVIGERRGASIMVHLPGGERMMIHPDFVEEFCCGSEPVYSDNQERWVCPRHGL